MADIKTYRRIGHRGAAGLAPPGNSVAAIREGLSAGADMVEVDVRATQDGVLVLGHNVVRMVDGHEVKLIEKTYDEWRRTLGPDEPAMETLEAALSYISRVNCGLMIDVREPGLENTLARMIRKFTIDYATILIALPSKSSRVVMRSLDPRIPIAHRLDPHQTEFDARELAGMEVNAVFWATKFVSEARVNILRKRGIVVYGGPANLAQDIRYLRDTCKVNEIVTDVPNLVAAL